MPYKLSVHVAFMDSFQSRVPNLLLLDQERKDYLQQINLVAI